MSLRINNKVEITLKQDKLKRAIFFDRDGIINFRPVGEYVREPEEFQFLPDFIEFFKRIKRHGNLALVVTNQQGIGKGLMTVTNLIKIHDYMQNEIFKRTGYNFDAIRFCPDLKQTNSFKRKPAPGMLLELISFFDIDRTRSWMIGDRATDIIAGTLAGVNTMLVGMQDRKIEVEPNLHFLNFYEAISHFDSIILKNNHIA